MSRTNSVNKDIQRIAIIGKNNTEPVIKRLVRLGMAEKVASAKPNKNN
jgi:hypothetical protein